MRIAIIGCGYVGSAAATYLKRQGHIVTVSTRDPKKVETLKSITQNVILLKRDHQNELDLEPILKDQEVVIIAVAPTKEESYYSTYFKTALRIGVLAPNLPHLKQIIYTSTTSVYGDCCGREIDEREPVKPSANKDSKVNVLIDTETIFRKAQSNKVQVAILRLGEIIGPGRELETKLRNMVGMRFAGTGENFTNFSPLELIVKSIAALIRTNSNGIYNCCSEEHAPRKDVYERVCRLHNIPQVVWDPTMPQKHGGNRRVYSLKLNTILERRPKI